MSLKSRPHSDPDHHPMTQERLSPNNPATNLKVGAKVVTVGAVENFEVALRKSVTLDLLDFLLSEENGETRSHLFLRRLQRRERSHHHMYNN